MKKILSILLLSCLLWSCEDFLDTESKTKKDTSNFPETAADADQLLTGAYAILGRYEPLQSSFLASELMSDNTFGGGDQNDLLCKAIDQFKKSIAASERITENSNNGYSSRTWLRIFSIIILTVPD